VIHRPDRCQAIEQRGWVGPFGRRGMEHHKAGRWSIGRFVWCPRREEASRSVDWSFLDQDGRTTHGELETGEGHAINLPAIARPVGRQPQNAIITPAVTMPLKASRRPSSRK
jgi:hypothetical protein